MIAQRSSVKDIDIIECIGDLNAPSMVALKNKLRGLMEKNRKKLVLDLGRTNHVDLAALGILVERIREVRSTDGDIKLCKMKPNVRRTFKMVGVSKLIDTFSTQNAAVRSFQLA